MAKRDWNALEKEFLLSEFNTVTDFLSAKSIKANGHVYKMTRGWSTMKAKLEEDKSRETVKKTVEKVIEQESQQKAEEIVDVKFVANEIAKKIAKLTQKVDNAKDLKCTASALKDVAELMPEIINKEKKNRIFIPAHQIASSFVNIYRSIRNGDYLEYFFPGGRGSLKSSFVSQVIVELLENDENACAVVIRRFTNTLRDSVSSQMEWAVEKFGESFDWLPKEYTFKKTPLEAEKESTGQKIYFRGTDDPNKLKSIKPPKGKYIAVIWYEEADQIQGMNSIRKINQSLVRGGNKFHIFYTYNTPPSRQHFINKEVRVPKANRIVCHTDYRSVPKEWLGQAFIDEAEYLKNTNLKTYENEYLGLETGDGGSVFENLEIRKITDEELKSFDKLYRGLDWGYYPDPFAYNLVYFDSARRTLYILDELVLRKTSNAETWRILSEEKNVSNEDLIIADSAEKKSIADFREYGAFIRGAEKGPGSVEYSMKWLSSLNKIVIDAEKCPCTVEEFSNYEYEKTKDGEVISGYPDKNNHNIDAIRYALERIWKEERGRRKR